MMIKNLTEMEDGSALIELDLSPEELQALIQSAVTIGLTEGIKLVEQNKLKELKECQELAQSTSNT